MTAMLTYLFLLSVLSFFAGRCLPYGMFHPESFPYKSFGFEREGKLYLSLKVNKWQTRVPDMSRIFPGMMPPKNLENGSADMLPAMIKETCIAEFIHGANSLLALFALRYRRDVWGILVVGLYIFLGNIPYILIQRYNRPRLMRIMKRMNLQWEN